jgi:RNA polymerase sigma factor (sigma-70 family)
MAIRLHRRSDEELVALARAGDPRGLDAIHGRYARPLRAYAARTLRGREHEADDVVQDVFLYAHGALREADDRLVLRPWLYWLTRNRCLDRLRRRSEAELEEHDATGHHDPLEEVARREDLRRLVADLARLPERQRSALVLRELEGMPHAEIASVLDISEPASRLLVLRARQGLARATEARDASCADIRADLAAAHDRGVRPSERTRVHLSECERCRAYRKDLRGTRRRLRALLPVGPLGWLAKLFGGGAAKVCAAGCVVAAVGGVTAYEVWDGQRVTREGERSPSEFVGEVPVAGQQIRRGGRLPAGFALVRRQVRLPVERRPVVRTVTLTCPPGMVVVATTDVQTRGKVSRLNVLDPLPYNHLRSIRQEYAPKPRLARAGRLTLGALCQEADAVAAKRRARLRSAIAKLPPDQRRAARAAPIRRACRYGGMYERPGDGAFSGVSHRDRFWVLKRRGEWVYGLAELTARPGWVRSRTLCR